MSLSLSIILPPEQVSHIPSKSVTASSVEPSQSLSLLSQISEVGPVLPVQPPQLPLLHVLVPVEHSPILEPQDCVKLSSVEPSQSLSTLSQISDAPG